MCQQRVEHSRGDLTTLIEKTQMLTTGSQRPLFDIPPGIAYFNTA